MHEISFSPIHITPQDGHFSVKMRAPGIWSLWKGLLVTILLSNSANAIDLVVTDEGM
jgi:hypothetical protein